MNRPSILALFVSLIYVLVLFFLGYHTERENFAQFILLFMTGFALFYGIWLNRQKWSFTHFLVLAVVLRLILLFAAPELSNDFYRFIWDGELITRGVNPYAHVPNELISQGPFYTDPYMRMLYHGMGELSQGNYSCYPVFNQFMFYFPASLSDSIVSNVITLKIIIILADIGTIFLIRKMLLLLNKPAHNVWLYALNPYVILEFTGNLHFEGVMIFFILLAIYLIMKDSWLIAAVFFGFAIQIKLIPIILLPFLLKKLKWRKSLGFLSMTAVVVISMGMLMINERFLGNITQSLDLYFTTFQFNASIAYLVREISLLTQGYDGIIFYGPFLSAMGLIGIVALAAFRKFKTNSDIFIGMMFAMLIYYAMSTTVHPWYISLILVFSIFTRYKFALVWSFLIMLSYATYANADFSENAIFILLEYLIVFGLVVFEIFRSPLSDTVGLQLKSFFKDE